MWGHSLILVKKFQKSFLIRLDIYFGLIYHRLVVASRDIKGAFLFSTYEKIGGKTSVYTKDRVL